MFVSGEIPVKRIDLYRHTDRAFWNFSISFLRLITTHTTDFHYFWCLRCLSKQKEGRESCEWCFLLSHHWNVTFINVVYTSVCMDKLVHLYLSICLTSLWIILSVHGDTMVMLYRILLILSLRRNLSEKKTSDHQSYLWNKFVFYLVTLILF